MWQDSSHLYFSKVNISCKPESVSVGCNRLLALAALPVNQEPHALLQTLTVLTMNSTALAFLSRFALVTHDALYPMQSGVTSTPINPIDRVSMEGGPGPVVPGQAPAVSYRLVKFDSSSSGMPGDNPGRFMLSGESATASTNLFQTASLAKSKKVAFASTAALHCARFKPLLLQRQHQGRCLAGVHSSGLRCKHGLAVHKTMLSRSL